MLDLDYNEGASFSFTFQCYESFNEIRRSSSKLIDSLERLEKNSEMI